ncbi:putative lipid II flippase FtsW [Candidatus Parcubacteria bacterium]|jgi:cell division protein FtsW|nr:MAG: putative lipid II flippase FtsW [Candidatus Parcubacteria bacterium]
MIAFRRPDSIFSALVLGLCILGIIILSSASSVEAFQSLGDPNGYLKKQLLSLLIGIFFVFLIIRVDYHFFCKLSVWIFVLAFILQFIPFIPGVGSELLGAHRWINVGGLFFQPSEFLKFAMLIYLSSWLPKIRNDWQDVRKTLLPFTGILAFAGLILMLQSDLGTTIIIFLTSTIMYFSSGAPKRHLLMLLLGAVVALALMVKLEPYRTSRLTIFLNPDADTQGTGYHINQSLLAIGSGGIFGRGLGKSIQKFNYLPEASGDSIFAIAAEELGFIVVLGIVAMYVAIFIRGRQLARQTTDESGRLIIIGTISWITLQAFINIGALTALLPLTGVPLPFVSNGGTALIISLAAVGVFLNVTKQLRS